MVWSNKLFISTYYVPGSSMEPVSKKCRKEPGLGQTGFRKAPLMHWPRDCSLGPVTLWSQAPHVYTGDWAG